MPAQARLHMAMDVEREAPFVPMHSAGRPFGRSGLGKQADSKKATAPMHSFGSVTDRDKAAKTFVSAEHLSVRGKCHRPQIWGCMLVLARLTSCLPINLCTGREALPGGARASV